ncbi:MAG: PIN domain-containing protein [Chloroflexota bacterium]|nr:PIN domain-containing protein [Chloroflexota bacterium]
MGRIEELRGQIVGMDTAPFIYFIEENPTYVKFVDPLFEAIGRNEFRVVTSMVTLLEVLVVPIRFKRDSSIQKYRDLLFKSTGISTVPVIQEIAEEAARLRSIYSSMRTPDAIQIATATQAPASYFLTNDARLPSLSGLKMLQLDELRSR